MLVYAKVVEILPNLVTLSSRNDDDDDVIGSNHDSSFNNDINSHLIDGL